MSTELPRIAKTVNRLLVMIEQTEARRRRHTPSFHATLLRWAGNMRRRAAENTEPRQHELAL